MSTSTKTFSDASFLIVDDSAINVRLLERILQRAGYSRFTSTTESGEALALFERDQPDLVLLDLIMPPPDGYELLEQIAARTTPDDFLPVLVLTSDLSLIAKERALSGGAKDFITKPFEETEVLLRIHNLLQARHLHQQVRRHNAELEERVRARTRDLEDAHAEILERLAHAAEYRDDDTGEHTRRVGRVAQALALRLGVAPAIATQIVLAAPLHDLGKVGIPDAVLLKGGPLSDAERELMKSHTAIGAAILGEGRNPLLQLAEAIAASHHEHWDGSGYLRGLSGEAIPLAGRICAVADVFDALTHARPYKEAWAREDALAEIVAQSGRKFDPLVVEALLALVAQGLV